MDFPLRHRISTSLLTARKSRHSTTLLIGLLALLLVATPVVVVRALTAPADPRQWTEAGATYWNTRPADQALAEAGSAAQQAGSGRAEQFYFVLPDRFANGDRANDRGGLTGDRLSTGLDPADKGFYHGGDLAGVLNRLDYIQGLGTTAIWLAPVFKNRPVQGTGADVSAGYHGYWITDFTQVDPHFGTNEQLRRLVSESHRRGIKVYLDVIVNHTADVIDYAEHRYGYVDKATSPYADAQGRAFEDVNYADGTSGFPKVDGTSFPYTPVFKTTQDSKAKTPAWLNDPTMYHNRGDSTFSGESSTNGDFFGLDDLWTERPEVVRGLTKVFGDWIGSTGVDGFRLDTVKHVNMEFWPQFSEGISKAARDAGKPGFFMFGEVYSADPTIASSYVREGGLPATLDFGFQAAAQGFVTGGTGQGLADLYAADSLYTARGTNANALPTFLGNHDMGRIGTFISTSGVDPASRLRRDQLAHELMFLTRGQPVIYSGDEQGFTGAGGDKDARQDMFASQVADYLDDDLLGTDRTHAVDQYDTAHPLYRTIADLGRLRKDHLALRDGTQTTRFAGNGVFAFSRVATGQQVEYLVAANSSAGAQTITVPTFGSGTTFKPVYGTASAATAAADGTMTVTVPALSSVVLRADRPIPTAGAPTISIGAPTDGSAVATKAAVTAVVGGDPLATVTVAAQVGDGPWQLLGTAMSAPYTVHHDLTGLAGRTPVKYKAVVRDRAGRTASAQTSIIVGSPVQGTQRDYVLVHYQRPAGDYTTWGLYTWGDTDPSMSLPWPQGQPFAGEDAYGRFAWVKIKPGATNVGFVVVDGNGVKDVDSDRSIDPSKLGEVWLKQGNPTVYPSLAAANGFVDVHYQRPDATYAGWGLHLWGDGLAPGVPTEWSSPRQPDGADSFGQFWRVPVADAGKPVNFIVHNGDNKDPAADLVVDPAIGSAWIVSGDSAAHPTRSAAEGVATLHYRRAAGDYTGWGLHLWDGAATPTDWNSPLLPASFDAYGAVFRVPLAAAATGLSYIVHSGDAKDLPTDQRLDLLGKGHEVWLLAGQADYLRPVAQAAARDIDLTKSAAQWIDRSTIVWRRDRTDGKVYELVVAPNGGLSVVDGMLTGDFTAMALTARPNGLTEQQRAAYPHLWSYHSFGVDTADLRKLKAALRAQLLVVERDHEGNLLSATGVQIPGALDDLYAGATQATLGASFQRGRPTLAVWAPTASTVKLQLFDSPQAAARLVDMVRDDATGVWRVTGDASWAGKLYRYQVTAWQPATRQVVTASVTDPYSTALSANSTHSIVHDLAKQPKGTVRSPKAPGGRAQIQELSVRDFSIADPSVPAQMRGTYAAFTNPATSGMTHLKSLADAGVTHLHLLPVFDFATIPERRADQQQPGCDLAALPPASPQQQACVAEVAATDGYNWGYDPLHYTTPEGGYAVNPDGAARNLEFQSMVDGLHKTGLRVVLDVVYNHTSAAGVDPKSVLDQLVPGYYHRLLDDGSVATSTCCANTAPEHAMMDKLVVESIVTWARQYGVDGFRFDLMGHHPKRNLLNVRAALDRLTMDRDGVDGKRVLLYGEGWNFGEVANNARFVQATQAEMAGTGIATFNDRMRDAVRGGGPFDGNPRVQGFGSGLFTDPNGDPVNGSPAEQKARLLHQQDLLKVGLAGNLADYRFVDANGRIVTGAQVDYNGAPAGYTAAPGEAVNYVDAHDNEILYDALAYKLPQGTSALDRARMQVLALSTVTFSQGVGFAAAGSDLLRSKSLDRNSYNSGDWFNAIRWPALSASGSGTGAAGATDGCLPGGNGFGVGLPPAADNTDMWQYAAPLLVDPALVPDCAAVKLSADRFTELLRIRAGSPLFDQRTASDVQRVLSFPLSGAAQTPGVLTMVLRSGKDVMVVVFNATPDTATQSVPTLRGADLRLHPVLRTSVDPVARQSTVTNGTGTFSVPGRTVAVFVAG